MSESRLFLFVTAKGIIEEVLNDLGTHIIIRRSLWTGIGSLLEGLAADPSTSHLEFLWQGIRQAIDLYVAEGGNRGTELLTAIETLQVDGNALQPWLKGISPSPSPAEEVLGLIERTDSMSGVTGPNDGDEAAAVGDVAEDGSEGEQTSRNTLDYSTSEAPGIPFGSAENAAAANEYGDNSTQSGGTADSTRSGM
jgi:hypothetical protein